MTVQIDAVAAATHVGYVRANNEDCHAIGDSVWVVADGLGGHAGGEVASELAVAAAVDALSSNSTADPESALETAYRAAHRAILEAAGEQPALAGMGTTLVLAWQDDGGTMHIGNLGDSRAYLLADGQLDLVTIDDNLAQELLDAGVLTAEQARVHPGQFRLSKALGLDHAEVPQPRHHQLTQPGRLLLCSDGLNSEVPDEQIAALLADGTPEDASERLVQAALEAGGKDNVTVLVLDLAEAPA